MKLKKLLLTHFRNIPTLTLFPDTRFNFIFGENGSGKTSILESIYLLGHGRSFRTPYSNRIIQFLEESLTVYGEVVDTTDAIIPMGVQKSLDGKAIFSISHSEGKTVGDLASILPLQLLNSESFELIDGGSLIRRQFMDWGMFHVEHSYLHLWRSVERILKQRNSALKQFSQQKLVDIWSEELIPFAENMDQKRRSYIEELIPLFFSILEQLYPLEGLDIRYYKGWPKDITLQEALANAYSRDKELGYTQYGPHRADLKFTLSGKPITDVLSRGQQKIVVYALRLAQGILLKNSAEKQCIYLLDDLPAELDSKRQEQVIEKLLEMKAQVFITGIELKPLISCLGEATYKLFHVEHGALRDLA